MAIKAFNENSKPTKTSKFMNLLIKFGIFPITFDGDIVQVKMMSLKTFFHFIILNGLTLFSQITSLQDFSLSTATTIDWITIIIIQSCTLVVTNIPLVISFGLNNLDKKVIQNNSFQWPKQGWEIIIAMLAFDLGSILNLSLTVDYLRIAYTLVSTLCIIPLFSLNPLFIAIMLETFQYNCKEIYRRNPKIFMIEGRQILINYKNITRAFGNFFFLFYVSNQLMNIFFVYFLYLIFSTKKEFLWSDVMLLSAYLLDIFSVTLNLVALTKTVDETYEEIQNFRDEINERLLLSTDEEERRQLEYLKNKSDNIETMSGAGYFEVNKNTLTNMLSIR